MPSRSVARDGSRVWTSSVTGVGGLRVCTLWRFACCRLVHHGCCAAADVVSVPWNLPAETLKDRPHMVSHEASRSRGRQRWTMRDRASEREREHAFDGI